MQSRTLSIIHLQTLEIVCFALWIVHVLLDLFTYLISGETDVYYIVPLENDKSMVSQRLSVEAILRYIF